MNRWEREQPSINSMGYENRYEYISNSKDLVIPTSGETTKVIYDKRVYSEADLDGSAEPNPGGRFYIDLGQMSLKLEQFDTNGVNLNAGWWLQAKNGRDYAIFSTDEDRRERVQFMSPYRIFMRPECHC